MQTKAKIIVEQIEGQWHAWFDDVPSFKRAADSPGEAVTSLLSLFTEIEFIHREIAAIKEMSSEHHIEFLIPYRLHRVIPRPSEN